jgi:hypothetical protein
MSIGCQKRWQAWLVTVSTMLFSFCLLILKQSDGWAIILQWKPERHHKYTWSAGCRVTGFQAHGLAIAKMILAALASCSVIDRDQELVHLHYECQEDQSCDLNCATQARTHELAYNGRIRRSQNLSVEVTCLTGMVCNLVGIPASLLLGANFLASWAGWNIT